MSGHEIVFTDGGTTLVIGETGVQGPAGAGVPNGGTAGQVLAKASAADQDTEWVTGGGGGVTAEEVRDEVAAFVVGGDNLTVTHDDAGDTLTLDVTGLAAVATSGDFADLSNQPTIPTQLVQLSDVTATGIGLGTAVSESDARDVLGLGTAATSAEGDFAEATHTHVEADVTDLKRVVERGYADSPGTLLGTGGLARTVATTQRKLIASGIALDQADTGTVEIRILSASGATRHTASVSISDAQSVTAAPLSWDTGDGTADAGEIVEIARTSGFNASTQINVPLRFEEDA